MWMMELLSIVLFGEGFLTGITLTAMVGPVTMIILRYGMQVNRIAGVWTAIGTWISDFVFIAATWMMTSTLKSWTEDPRIRIWIYIIGGTGLMLTGFILLRGKSSSFDTSEKISAAGYTQAFAGGFIVNSLSPFTLFFWIGAAFILQMQSDNPLWYYVGLMISLAMGDFAKAWLAPKLATLIKEKYIYWVQLIAGIAIIITGIYIIGMGIWESGK